MLRWVCRPKQKIFETRNTIKRHKKKASAAACKLQAANIGSLTYPANGMPGLPRTKKWQPKSAPERNFLPRHGQVDEEKLKSSIEMFPFVP